MGRVTTLTSKGQVTIPKAIRDELGLKPHDKIAFTVENGHATLHKTRLSLADMEGMLPPLDVSVEDMSTIAREEWVERYAEENG